MNNSGRPVNGQKPRRGRKRIELSDEIKEKILYLKGKKLTIKEIAERLQRDGITVSEYQVWRVLKQAELDRFYREFLEVISTFERVLGVLIVKANEEYKVLAIIDVPEFELLDARLFESVTVRRVISTLEAHRELLKRGTLLYIARVPPLVPTRCNENKLTRYLDHRGVEYRWLSPKFSRHVYRCIQRSTRDVQYNQSKEELLGCAVELITEKLFKEKVRFQKWLEGQR